MLALQRTLLPHARRPQCKKHCDLLGPKPRTHTQFFPVCVTVQLNLSSPLTSTFKMHFFLSLHCLSTRSLIFYLDCHGNLQIMSLLFYITKIIFKKNSSHIIVLLINLQCLPAVSGIKHVPLVTASLTSLRLRCLCLCSCCFYLLSKSSPSLTLDLVSA